LKHFSRGLRDIFAFGRSREKSREGIETMALVGGDLEVYASKQGEKPRRH